MGHRRTGLGRFGVIVVGCACLMGAAGGPRMAGAQIMPPDSIKLFKIDSTMLDSALRAAKPAQALGADIDVLSYASHARVEHFLDVFCGRARAPFIRSLQQQTRYDALIRDRLRAGGLPEGLTYLALIESWYNPHAYSKAAAVGMWQFMAGTARGVGLRVDWWVDERRDPVRSTEGAARLLKGLQEQFGSLFLAAAAYNGGDGRVARGLARNADALDGVEGEDRFFTLASTRSLRPETRDYVPKIIAAALIGQDPARCGITVDSLPPFVFDSVRVPGSAPLAAVANAAGADVSAITELNPHILRGMMPPGDSLWVRVPAGTVTDEFADRWMALEPEERTALTTVSSKKGQSLASIAHKYGLTARQVGWYNPGLAKRTSGALRPGQRVLVPSHATVAAARDVPNPSAEHYPRRARAAHRRTGKKSPHKKPT